MTEVIILRRLFLELKFDKLEFQPKIEFIKLKFQSGITNWNLSLLNSILF